MIFSLIIYQIDVHKVEVFSIKDPLWSVIYHHYLLYISPHLSDNQQNESLPINHISKIIINNQNKLKVSCPLTYNLWYMNTDLNIKVSFTEKKILKKI